MEWDTRITRLLHIKYPIIEGALANIGNAKLAAAVSEAGGLGMITAWTLHTPDRVRQEIRKAKSLTNKPFAVNLSPAMHPSLPAMLEVAIEEKVSVIETAASRATDLGKRVKEAGLIWIHKCDTVRHALAAERDGADAVCVMGVEGAGLKNPNMLTTLVTIPLVVKSVKIPVIAAGGIGDARTFLGALALGADAVLMGTVFCAVKECPLSEKHKQALVDADPYDPRWRIPALTTPSSEDMQKVKEASDGEAAARLVGRAERGGAVIPKEAGIGTASLAIGFIKEILTAKELIDSIITEAEEILTSRGIGGWTLAPKSSAR